MLRFVQCTYTIYIHAIVLNNCTCTLYFVLESPQAMAFVGAALEFPQWCYAQQTSLLVLNGTSASRELCYKSCLVRLHLNQNILCPCIFFISNSSARNFRCSSSLPVLQSSSMSSATDLTVSLALCIKTVAMLWQTAASRLLVSVS